MKTELQITNFAMFEEIVNSLEISFKKIKDVFESQNKNRESITQTDSWSGKAQEAFLGKYEQLSQNFAPIEFSIDLYIKFMRKTLEDYKLAEEAIMKNMEEMATSMDVNS